MKQSTAKTLIDILTSTCIVAMLGLNIYVTFIEKSECAPYKNWQLLVLLTYSIYVLLSVIFMLMGNDIYQQTATFWFVTSNQVIIVWIFIIHRNVNRVCSVYWVVDIAVLLGVTALFMAFFTLALLSCFVITFLEVCCGLNRKPKYSGYVELEEQTVKRGRFTSEVDGFLV